MIKENLLAIGGVDAVLLSHADIQHIGALPIICGVKGTILTALLTNTLN